jgi:hypothetical protein
MELDLRFETKGAPQEWTSDIDQLSVQRLDEFTGVLSPRPFQRLLWEAFAALAPERFGGSEQQFDCHLTVVDGELRLSVTRSS